MNIERIKEGIIEQIKEIPDFSKLNLSSDWFQKTPSSDLGDLAFQCFPIAKQLGENPQQIAKKIEVSLSSKKIRYVENVKAVGPYLNFFLDSREVIEALISGITYEKAKEPKKIMIEYSSPNTNKPQHLGHVRNNLLGMAISQLLEHQGNKTIKVNLLNDRGLGVSKVIYAYLYLSKEKEPNKKPDHFVGDLYLLFNKEVKKRPELEQEAQRILKRWEENDEEVISAWRKIREFVIEGYKETYKKLGCLFDKEYFESDIYKEGKEIIMEGLKKGIFKEKDGAIIAPLEKFGLPDKVLIKSNGTALYITQDIALTKKKFEDFDIDYSIYVVASEQELYFKQLFKIIELLNIASSDKLYHLAYGMILVEGGKMKSREGNIVDADSIIKELEELASLEVEQRYPALSEEEKKERTEKIAISALKFYILKVDPSRDILFKPKESISFQGETGPYLQYTYARIKSILRKSGLNQNEITMNIDLKYFENDECNEEKAIALLALEFPSVIEKAAESLKPSLLCRYLLDFAQLINSYYHDKRVIGEEKDIMRARLALLLASSEIIKKGLWLLGIPILEEM
ncbi:MAG: arginyl-tRNA synthetase [Candidatus Woesearchaeota archaeon]|nr:arginyl-tRNA synthetase [Candidatus Woesearchaeota archaeon]